MALAGGGGGSGVGVAGSLVVVVLVGELVVLAVVVLPGGIYQ